MKQPTILVVDETPASGTKMLHVLGTAGYNGFQVRQRTEISRLLTRDPPDLIILGVSDAGPGRDLDLATELREAGEKVPLILLVSHSSEEVAIAALRAGINDYLRMPLNEQELVGCVKRCLVRSHASERCDAIPFESFDRFIGNSASMREVRSRSLKAAATDSNVLVTGETGTGKELVAELLHRHSSRRKKPFVTINCAAIPDSLLESELFGYQRGAFTGAQQSREGKVDSAQGGTVFLDEIGDMSLLGQAKILRMIECHEVQPLGRKSATPINIRIIAATNRELEHLTRDGAFRKDLFFRLAVSCIHLPPLRDRREDLLDLLNYYIRYYNQRFGRSVRRLSEQAIQLIMAYDWPGNVRELKNLVEVIFVDLPSPDTEVADLPAQFRSRCADLEPASNDERARLVRALSAANWNKSKAASGLHWSRMTLYRKMALYKIG